MANGTKKSSDSEEAPISVYSFAGSIIIPTEQGSYWATAVGGVIESRPTGNPSVLFSLRYMWDMAGQVSEFPEPIMVRLNTAMAVIEKFNFKFPDPEVPVEVPVETPMVEGELGGEDEFEDEDIEEGEGVDEVGDEEMGEGNLAQASHGDDELSW